MEELIKYFESLEARIAAQEARLADYEARIAALEQTKETNEAVIASMEAEIEELKTIPAPVPVVKEIVIEKETVPAEPEKPEVTEEPADESSSNSQQPLEEPEKKEQIIRELEKEDPVKEEPVKEDPVIEEPENEVVSPKAAIYGKAVSDIRLAISLGDRFLYQRELFGQNAELMQRTLTELNELNSFDEALKYISRFGWDTESNTYQQFVVTLHRRFG